VRENSSLENTELLRHIFREIIRINIILQTYGVWHRDCKPENILYCKNDRSIRFIDFGSAAPVQVEDFHEFQVCFYRKFQILKYFLFFLVGNIRNHGTRMDITKTL
jgi:serine/threonine protein kinase